jgi:protein required for attachment to host cells
VAVWPSCVLRKLRNLRVGVRVVTGSRARVVLKRMTQTWILVGDGSHARVFQTDDASHPWQLVRKIDREHSREKTDRNDSHGDHGEQGFARQIVAELETGREQGTFAKLVLVAPPKFLGQLRGELAAPLAACVVKSVDHDYTHMAAGELPKHIDLS